MAEYGESVESTAVARSRLEGVVGHIHLGRVEPQRDDDDMHGPFQSGTSRSDEHSVQPASQDAIAGCPAGQGVRARDQRHTGHDFSLQLPHRAERLGVASRSVVEVKGPLDSWASCSVRTFRKEFGTLLRNLAKKAEATP